MCVWWLIEVALRATQWFAIATSQLAGHALSRVMPAGAAAGAALQYACWPPPGSTAPRSARRSPR